MILALFAQLPYVNVLWVWVWVWVLHWKVGLYCYGFLVNEGIDLILVIHAFYPSTLCALLHPCIHNITIHSLKICKVYFMLIFHPHSNRVDRIMQSLLKLHVHVTCEIGQVQWVGAIYPYILGCVGYILHLYVHPCIHSITLPLLKIYKVYFMLMFHRHSNRVDRIMHSPN